MRCERCGRDRPLTYRGLGWRAVCADCVRDLMKRKADVLIGLEVTCLDLDRELFRMTVDCWDSERQQIVRYQLTGAYNGWPTGPPERRVEDMASVWATTSLLSDPARAVEVAEAFDLLDREAIAQMQPIMEWLFHEQAVVLYGQDIAEKLLEDE